MARAPVARGQMLAFTAARSAAASRGAARNHTEGRHGQDTRQGDASRSTDRNRKPVQIVFHVILDKPQGIMLPRAHTPAAVE
jgi:hypothetical protein